MCGVPRICVVCLDHSDSSIMFHFFFVKNKRLFIRTERIVFFVVSVGCANGRKSCRFLFFHFIFSSLLSFAFISIEWHYYTYTHVNGGKKRN